MCVCKEINGTKYRRLKIRGKETKWRSDVEFNSHRRLMFRFAFEYKMGMKLEHSGPQSARVLFLKTTYSNFLSL